MKEEELNMVNRIKKWLNKEDEGENYITNQDLQELLNLIMKYKNLYEKEKEKSEKLMEELDLTTIYLSGIYDGEKKVKDKIKVKIEEYTNLLNTLNQKADIERIKGINETILAFKEILKDKE